MIRHAGPRRALAQRLGDRGNQVARGRTRPRQRALDVLRGEHAYGMPDDIGGQAGIGRD